MPPLLADPFEGLHREPPTAPALSTPLPPRMPASNSSRSTYKKIIVAGTTCDPICGFCPLPPIITRPDNLEPADFITVTSSPTRSFHTTEAHYCNVGSRSSIPPGLDIDDGFISLMNDDGDTKDDVKVSDDEVGKLFDEHEKDTSTSSLHAPADTS
ncbi:uncharacterized protein MYCGRDRAFT_97962 [Zymoseptoria tritici IPO323]|uniref:Translation initiation factor 5A C-terminal domain-containing protein n=1 Tax=Zymoseptoria tritici (strain CBS 115943 / IPO323) TaxID=336722 RepID=F9XRW8_ZYMTI|nr:uncharacterized protein MYCGRDRAFT_97962 [Zymoseptoria tritici IPO323]EGP81991.1 hypothetical protein MYCGRDRAFT_97962 [Zymoseptoria tritici IPO323]